MTKKTRNEYIALAVVLLVLGYLLYHYVLGGGSSSVPTTLNPVIIQSSTSGTSKSFLPNGSTLDTSVLQNPVFTSLVPLPQFNVTASDLGISNLFTGGASTAPIPPANSTSSGSAISPTQ